ncbi:phosphoadenosine phosphosulfate reductase [Rhodosalinus sp.]|uniref:phosphoadenosine phosphosulfate reductase n=1 Tax=Rhodosalinus sp. TaxID=2047741 RepID=UPI003564BB52
MQDAPDLDSRPLTGLERAEWLDRMAEITVENGHFAVLGRRHIASYIDHGGTLLVTFETVEGTRALSEREEPLGWQMVRDHGWSHLCLMAQGDTWFRDRDVYDYVDRLIDEAFFEDFERVVFYGAGPCGYAAAAYSVAAPGASVIAVQPQATLDPEFAEWDDRFVEMRRTDFTERYGYAPAMVDAAIEMFLIYDPHEQLDAMHAALFQGDNVERLRLRNMGGAIQGDLIGMGLIAPLLAAAGDGVLDRELFYELMRARRDHVPYLRRLLARAEERGRLRLAWRVCRNVAARLSAPRFARRMERLDAMLGETA